MGRPNSSIEANEKDQIRQTMDRWAKAIQEGNLETIGSLVTEEAFFWTHGTPGLKGRKAVKNSFKQFFQQYKMIQDFDQIELIISGDYAFLRGIEINRLISKKDQEKTIVHQRAFSILKKGSDGIWRFHRGMTNLPPEK